MTGYELMSAVQAELLKESDRDSGKVGQQLRFIFDKMISDADINRAIEVGAYEASFSKKFKRRYPDANVIAYEANPHVFNRFKGDVESAGVDYKHLCVGPENGELTISIPRDFRGTARPADNQMASLMSNLHSEESEDVVVRCVRLDDDVQPAAEDRIALWVDVEGATSQVFGAASRTLERTALVFVEVESRPIWEGQWLASDVNKFMESHGFVPIARDIQRVHQFNFIYAKPAMVEVPKYARLVSRYLAGTHVFAPQD